MFILDSVPAHSALMRATTASDGTRFETYYPVAGLGAHDLLPWVYVKATYSGDTANPVWYQFDWSHEDYCEYYALVSKTEAEIEAEIDYEY